MAKFGVSLILSSQIMDMLVKCFDSYRHNNFWGKCHFHLFTFICL